MHRGLVSDSKWLQATLRVCLTIHVCSFADASLVFTRTAEGTSEQGAGDAVDVSTVPQCAFFPHAGVFELTVLGKNGVSIDGVLFTPNSSPAPLASRVRSQQCPDATIADQCRSPQIGHAGNDR